MIEATPSVTLHGPGCRAMSELPRTTHGLPDGVVAAAERALGEDAATWVVIPINAWNRVAVAGHQRAGEYEPA